MWIALLVASAVSLAPAPSPTPLKTITNVHSTPFCTAFNDNIRHGVEGVLVNDDLFKRTEPVFLKAAHDLVAGGPMESSFNSMHAARPSADNSSVILDMARIQEIDAAIVKNLQKIDTLLNDTTRFPKEAKTPEEQQLVDLRAQLLRVAKQQNDELNILSGSSEQYMLDRLYSSDVSLGGALSANGKPLPDAGTLGGGPLQSKGDAGNPVLLQNNLFMNSTMGQMYQALVIRVNQEQTMEMPLAHALVAASASCLPKR